MTDGYLTSMKRNIETQFNGLQIDFSHVSCVLLDFPTYGNVGDQLIWLGEICFLDKYLKAKVKFSSHVGNAPLDILRDCIGKDDIILLQGGGNWGDLWPKHQHYREEIIGHFKENRIIVFPQTIFFENEESLRRSAAIINGHPRLTIMVRDRVSDAIARAHYTKAEVRLCPDMAFYLDLPSGVTGSNRSLVIVRKDKELSRDARVQAEKRQDVMDWDDLPSAGDRLKIRFMSFCGNGMAKLIRFTHRCRWPGLSILLYRWSARLYQYNGEVLSHRAVKKFQQYETITSTRMHGHILATLMQINNVLLPNSYHKNKAFFECWCGENSWAQFRE